VSTEIIDQPQPTAETAPTAQRTLVANALGGLEARFVAERLSGGHASTIVYVTRDAQRSAVLAALVRFFDPGIEILTLPWSEKAMPDQGKEELRVILNIVKVNPEKWKPGDPVEVRYKGQTLDLDTLTKRLLNFANRDRDMDHPMQPSEVFALIRCDQDIRWREVQWVMQACAHPDVRIYKIQFATKKPDNQ